LAAKSGSDTPGERTEQERERAREERERRRLAKAAAQAPVAPPLPAPLPESEAVVEPELPQPSSQHASTPPREQSPLSESPLPEQLPPPEPVPLLRQAGPHEHFEQPPRRIVPHLHRPHPSRPRLGVLIALIVVLVVLAAGAVVLLRPTSHPVPVPPPPKVVKLVIPEGFTRAQIAQRAHADGVSGNYLAASTHSVELNPQHYGAPARTPNLEGFLFPATYEIYAGEPASRLVDRQVTAFEENFGPTQVRRAHALGITSYQLLIVASMVEREAQIPSDRAKIAAVIYNRLHAGMPLGIDATIYYAVEQRKHIATYEGELTESDLHINSPYNTRLHAGLPPTPISNPGLASIEAAGHPAHVSYLYYVAGADGCGEQVFSDTETQFESDVAAYKAAVAHNGGKPPACKRKP
jgi:cell division protein YceG involved in septum cleavage